MIFKNPNWCKIVGHVWRYCDKYLPWLDIVKRERKCLRCGLEQEFDEGTKIGLVDMWWDK